MKVKVSFSIIGLLAMVLALCGSFDSIASSGLKRPKKCVIRCVGSKLNSSSKVLFRLENDVFEDFKSEVTDQVFNREFLKSVTDHAVEFILSSISKPRYAVLYLSGVLDEKFIIWPGDSINIQIDESEVTFSGRNAAAYDCEYRLNKAQKDVRITSVPPDPGNTIKYFRALDSLAFASFDILDEYKDSISLQCYRLIKGRIIDYFQYRKYRCVTQRGDNEASIRPYYSTLDRYTDRVWDSDVAKGFSKQYELTHSAFYLHFVIRQYKMDSCFKTGREFNVTECYKYISTIFSVPVKEWAICYLIKENAMNDQSVYLRRCIKDALGRNLVTHPFIVKYLNDLERVLPGAFAFDFALPDSSGKIIRQRDFRGKMVLIDTWHEPCGACVELHPIIDSIKHLFNENKFVVVSISINYLKFSKKKWLNLVYSGRYTSKDNINLLLDTDKHAAFLNYYNIEGDPTLILIDSKGKISRQPISPRYDQGASLVSIIKTELK